MVINLNYNFSAKFRCNYLKIGFNVRKSSQVKFENTYKEIQFEQDKTTGECFTNIDKKEGESRYSLV